MFFFFFNQTNFRTHLLCYITGLKISATYTTAAWTSHFPLAEFGAKIYIFERKQYKFNYDTNISEISVAIYKDESRFILTNIYIIPDPNTPLNKTNSMRSTKMNRVPSAW